MYIEFIPTHSQPHPAGAEPHVQKRLAQFLQSPIPAASKVRCAPTNCTLLHLFARKPSHRSKPDQNRYDAIPLHLVSLRLELFGQRCGKRQHFAFGEASIQCQIVKNDTGHPLAQRHRAIDRTDGPFPNFVGQAFQGQDGQLASTSCWNQRAGCCCGHKTGFEPGDQLRIDGTA